jgi:hypothetical protein
MKACLCDRCGKVCENNLAQVGTIVFDINVTVEYGNAYQTIQKVDLCKNCKEQLFEFLNLNKQYTNCTNNLQYLCSYFVTFYIDFST